MINSQANGRDIRINRWYGRYGGHVKQLVYAMFLAEASKSSLSYPPHPWFDNKKFSFKENEIDGPIISKSFFYGKDMWIKPGRADVYRIGQKYVYPLLKCKMVDIPNSTVVIHLRSGDIFRASPHKAYVQPPLSFYKKIISSEKYKEVIVITDKSKNNPCVSWLSKTYGAKIICGNAMDDFGWLVSAPNLILSRSNFSIAASWVSRNLRNLYYHIIEGTGPYNKNDITAINDVGISLKQYLTTKYIKHKCWTASPAQKKLMTTHLVKHVIAM